MPKPFRGRVAVAIRDWVPRWEPALSSGRRVPRLPGRLPCKPCLARGLFGQLGECWVVGWITGCGEHDVLLIQHGATLARTLVLPVAELDGAGAPADPGEVTRPGDQPIGLDSGAMASLAVGSIAAAQGPCPLVVAEPSG